MRLRQDPRISALLLAASDTMLNLMIHPLALDVDADGVRLLAVMKDHALRTRSRGPYTPDDLPPEAMEMVRSVALRLSQKPEGEAYTVEGGGVWPALLVELPQSRVTVRYMVPEAAPRVYQPDPGDGTLSSNVRSMLKYTAESLRLAGDPPVTLRLGYEDDPRYGEFTEHVGQQFRDTIPPVLAVLAMDRSRCSRKQRAAHDAALRRTAIDGQELEPLGRTGFTTRRGWACLRDTGS
ncbi:hypothetical protein EES39_30705 [Streptomyces sp. ADI92-24]|uniref:hypothetical protein n=1 Tax=unclassified Streptomyces TaxID=2593676 RepID=UPI000F49218F|nr:MULTISPECIES: hypothetical protein [unclassified Streptomyces]ROQ78282.1 hypothetical protein EDD95_4888 [Streptomyces sp. CEV 2-1]RPK37504.1 hypothetical protein EES39_30705 [Streptomyces sp. ADI92-24]